MKIAPTLLLLATTTAAHAEGQWVQLKDGVLRYIDLEQQKVCYFAKRGAMGAAPLVTMDGGDKEQELVCYPFTVSDHEES